MNKFYLKKTIDNEESGNIFWTTMSDLMLGLAIIFITLFVIAMTGFSQQSIKQQKIKIEMSKQIESELHKSNISVKINRMTGDLEIPAAALFDLNSSNLTEQGKDLLSKLAPIYINTIFSNKNISNDIENIVVEGHTDSQTFAGVNSVDEQFIKNMDLSLRRANSVASYMLKTNYDRKNAPAFRKIIVVEGKSYNEPILVNGKEDYAKSRRVEIKLKVKNWNVASALGLKI